MLRIMTRMALFASLLLAPAALAQDDYDQWYVLEMLGERSGYMHNFQRTSDGRIETGSEQVIVFKRGDDRAEIAMDQTWVETVDGEPLRLTTMQKLGTDPVTTVYRFEGDSMKVSTNGGEEIDVPVPTGEWMTPGEAARAFNSAIEAGEKTISNTILQPTPPAGLVVVTSTYSNIEETTVEVLGKVVPAIRADVTNTMYPTITAETFLDRQGVPLREEIDAGFTTITTLAADKALALSEVDPPELMSKTFVTPKGRYGSNPRLLKKASYILSIEGGTMPTLPSAASQRVEVLNDRISRVVVDTENPLPAGDVDTAPYLEASSLLDSSDERIIELTKKATSRAGEAPAARAEAMRRFVYDYVDEKDFGVGFATASEVCRTRAGDCSEHGVLLAAMLRADGIPSRTVSGVVYVESFLGGQVANVFGYHMWAQALVEVDGKRCWIDLDGTFPRQLATDATHIALSVSGMADDEAFGGLVEMVPLMGRLKIEIE